MANLTSEELAEWRDHPVSKEYFSRVRQMAEDYDGKIHENLRKGKLQEAAQYEVALDLLRETLAAPETMIDEVRGEGDDGR